MTRRTRTIAALLAVTLTLAGCGLTSTLQDLEGVHAVEPDLLQVYYAPDQFPNVSIACPDGAEGFGIITTTREYQDPIFVERCPITRERGDVISGLGGGGEGE
jgi:hypothetical protein